MIPEFQSVKHLELECRGAELFAGSGYSLRRFFGVIQACPALEILEIKVRACACSCACACVYIYVDMDMDELINIINQRTDGVV